MNPACTHNGADLSLALTCRLSSSTWPWLATIRRTRSILQRKCPPCIASAVAVVHSSWLCTLLCSNDPVLFRSTSTGRGPLAAGWFKEAASTSPRMCCYKLVRAGKWRGRA